jgi:hypothetical protein
MGKISKEHKLSVQLGLEKPFRQKETPKVQYMRCTMDGFLGTAEQTHEHLEKVHHLKVTKDKDGKVHIRKIGEENKAEESNGQRESQASGSNTGSVN